MQLLDPEAYDNKLSLDSLKYVYPLVWFSVLGIIKHSNIYKVGWKCASFCLIQVVCFIQIPVK